MNNTVKILIVVLVFAVIIYFMTKGAKTKTYLNYLHSLGFNIADKMTADEIQTSYIYLHDFARKYGANAASILRSADPNLYYKAEQVAAKYHIFNIPLMSSDTNIPNIATPTGAVPIIPDVKVVTALDPSKSNNQIIPPTLNIV
jgi:hypothetical protein